MAPEPHHDTRSDDELARRLRANHITLRTEPLGAERVVAVARRRTRRRRAALAGAAVAGAVAAAGATLTVTQLDRRDGTEVATEGDAVAATADTSPPDVDGGTDDAALDLEWGAGVDGGLYGVGDSTVAADGTIYALAVDPDRAPASTDPVADLLRTSMALYRFGDDGTWARSPTPGAMSVDAIAADGDRLRVIGETSDAHAPAVATSDDEGDTWNDEELPVSAEPPSDAIRWQRSIETSIEVSGGSTLAVVESYYEPADWSELFPEWDTTTERRTGPNAATSGELWVGAQDDGMVLGFASGDVAGSIETVAWADLGIDGLAALNTPMVDAYISRGGSWAPVALPIPGGEVRAADGGFLISASVPDPDPPADVPFYGADPVRTVAFWSPDGRSWSPLEVPDGTRSVAVVGDAFVATGRVLDPEDPPENHPRQAENTIVVSQDRGSSWTPMDIGALDERLADPHIGEPVTGPLGVVIPVLAATAYTDFYGDPHVYWTNHLQDQYLLVSSDLVDWEVVPVADLVDDVGDDEPVELHPVVGADRIALSVTFASWDLGEPGPEGTADPGDPAATYVGVQRG